MLNIIAIICYFGVALYYATYIIKNRKRIPRKTMVSIVLGIICYIIVAILYIYKCWLMKYGG